MPSGQTLNVFLSLALIIVIGGSLRYLIPELDIDDLRRKLHRLVLAIFLPALNFTVIYQADVKSEFWQIPLCSLGGLVVTLGLGAYFYRKALQEDARMYAPLVLAGAFGNVTYLGIPVLQGLFSHVSRSVATAILYEMTITPLNLVMGSVLAAVCKISARVNPLSVLKEVAKLPLLWSIAVALVFNLAHWPVPDFVMDALGLLSQATSGIMIVALGMALKVSFLKGLHTRALKLLPCMVLKLGVSPLVIMAIALAVGLNEPFRSATFIEAAMPTQLVTLAVADRFGFETEALATVIFLNTIISFFTLPILRSLLGGGMA